MGEQINTRNEAASTGDPASFLTISNLSKSFGSVAVIQDLSIRIGKGEFVSLLGPSGCGKTTTLRIIAGFIAPSSGRIVLDGRRIDGDASHLRGAAMVFQNYALFPHMTVAENVGFGLRMQKRPRPEIHDRVGEALKLVRLEALAQRYPKELSGGQQQRVALARAVVLRPKLLLLDEPLSNLDAKLRKELRAEFLKIHEIAGTTTIFVTHDLEEAFSISDRVAVMNHGRVEQYDRPMAIFEQPKTSFVAEFVGHSNVLSGEVEKLADGHLVLHATGSARFSVSPGATVGRRIRLAIPAHLIEVTAAKSEAGNCLPARVLGASYLGTAIHYELEADGLRLHAEAPVRSGSPLFGAGDHVYASWRASDFIVLPTGEP